MALKKANLSFRWLFPSSRCAYLLNLLGLQLFSDFFSLFWRKKKSLSFLIFNLKSPQPLSAPPYFWFSPDEEEEYMSTFVKFTHPFSTAFSSSWTMAGRKEGQKWKIEREKVCTRLLVRVEKVLSMVGKHDKVSMGILTRPHNSRAWITPHAFYGACSHFLHIPIYSQ